MRHAEHVTFGGSGLDRAAHMRREADQLASRPDARALVLWRGRLLVSQTEDRLFRVPCDDAALEGSPRVFLGFDAEAPVFAVDLRHWEPSDGHPADVFIDKTVTPHPAFPNAAGFKELRACMVALSAREAELSATAKALLGWHETHRFCARCGSASDMAEGGWQRICPSCGAHHFPRTDPVVIMLITHGNATLLGRSHGWPEGMYSCLAGFVEPGEPIEAAVRREVFEEAGVAVGRVRYLASQPWAFPSSLMFGCHGEALGTELRIDPVEIEDARWITREDLARAFAGEDPGLMPARKGSIAQFLLANWLADRLD